MITANTLNVVDFAKLFGTAAADLQQVLHPDFGSMDFNFRFLSMLEFTELAAEFERRLKSGGFTKSGDIARWQKGWEGQLQEFLANGNVTPRYMRPGDPLRLWGRFVQPDNPNFEANWYKVFQHWLFKTYFDDPDAVYEFGCGSGINIAELIKLFPNKTICGCDWAPASVALAFAIADYYKAPAAGGCEFDFFHPEEAGLTLKPNSKVLTVGALEQTGENWKPFVSWLISQRPALVVNIEPVLDWYRWSNSVDQIARKHHTARNYWAGFIPWLHEQEAAGVVETLKLHRAWFGSKYIEGYSQVIWRPK